MLNAFVFSVLAQAPLVLGGLLVYWLKIPTKVVGWLGGFGAGALFSAIAFNLIAQAETMKPLDVVVFLMIGAGVFAGLDYLVDKKFGEQAGALGIVLGAIIDGVPESVIFGIQLALGSAISPAFLTAVMVSNIPQAIAPSADLARSGRTWAQVARMWMAVVLMCGVAGAAAYFVGMRVPSDTGSRVAAFAAGGLLAMLTNSLIPFSFTRGGLLTGIWAAGGFALSLLQQ
jgi:zinc transporter, ZIP family